MKRSRSDWDLDEFFRPAAEAGEVVDGTPSPAVAAVMKDLLAAQKPQVTGGGVPFATADVYCHDMGLEFVDREAISSHSPGGPLTGGQMWSHQHSSISATIESPSSICDGSPILSHKPKGTENQALGGTSGSEQSDDESLEIEAGSCEQGSDVIDLKRMRRMVSNRESARRSRKRKQAHLADLELQVDQLRGENSTLFKQLTDANQQFGDAVTDNRVLKSDVEALRVKVKMAEDLVTRGSMACGLDHLLGNTIGSNQLLNARHLCRGSEISPIVELQADDAGYVRGSTGAQIPNIVMASNENKNGSARVRMNQSSPLRSIASLENMQSRISSEVTSCAADIWAWDSPTNAISKQL